MLLFKKGKIKSIILINNNTICIDNKKYYIFYYNGILYDKFIILEY